MKVGHPVDIRASSGSHSININTISRKGRGENTALNVQLCRLARILGNLLADALALVGMVPVKVEGDKDLHAISGSGLVGKVELLVCVGVDTDVESEGVDASGLGLAHVIVVFRGAVAVTDDSNLSKTCVSQWVVLMSRYVEYNSTSTGYLP